VHCSRASGPSKGRAPPRSPRRSCIASPLRFRRSGRNARPPSSVWLGAASPRTRTSAGNPPTTSSCNSWPWLALGRRRRPRRRFRGANGPPGSRPGCSPSSRCRAAMPGQGSTSRRTASASWPSFPRSWRVISR
jgi:hypothetical protein